MFRRLTGGLDLAVERVFGATTVWHAETDPAASGVLAHRWPGVPNLGDLMAVDWFGVEPIDVICAGFPCQDVSAAGRRAGLRHGTRTGVWHGIVTALKVLRPGFVVLENVPGLLTADGDEWPDSVHALYAEVARWGRIRDLIKAKKRKHRRRGDRERDWWHRKQAEGVRAARRHRVALARFSRERLRLVPRAVATVLGSLAQAGYDARWCCVSASDVGAPHRRERIFILATLADADGFGTSRRLDSRTVRRMEDADPQPGSGSERIAWRLTADSGAASTADADGGGRGAAEQNLLPGKPHTDRGTLADAEDERWTGGIESQQNMVDNRPQPAHGHSGTGPVELLPTPRARDHKDGRNSLGGSSGHDLPTALLPTPNAADGGRGPDYARAGREESGSDDLVTCLIKATNSGELDASACLPRAQGKATGTGKPPLVGRADALLPTPQTADGQGGHMNRSGDRKHELLLPGIAKDNTWGKYSAAIARWETLTRPAPPPTEPNRNGKPRLNPEFSSWLMGWPQGWVTQVPGVNRNNQLKTIGNGVVPQQAAAALQYLLAVSCGKSFVGKIGATV